MKKFTILLVVCLFLFINYTKSQTWTTYTTANGLVNNNVKAIAIDAQGNKWFGCGVDYNNNGGVSKLSDICNE